LLQGPNGPLFRRIGAELSSVGAEVSKINLNAADAFFFSGPSAHAYRGTFDGWRAYLEGFLIDRDVDAVFLFGDCRPYHQVATTVAEACGVDVYVFEEGYLRPDYITVERGGVNTKSPMPRDAAAYELDDRAVTLPKPVRHAFAWSVWFTILNSFFVTFFWPFFPHYRHHRDVNFFRQTGLWARSLLRRVVFAWREAKLLPLLSGTLSKRYFLVGLQVHNDFQVKTSRFGDVEDFIREVVSSFAAHADPTHCLVLKHHPADRAYRDYTKLVAELGREHRLGDRLVYVHDLHLPSLLRHARGTIVINSTVGLSALYHRTPVFALGEAIYGRMGLTAGGTLPEFFRAPPPVDHRRCERARAWLVRHNQANGSIWVRLAGVGPSGLVWPENFGMPSERAKVRRQLRASAPRRVEHVEPAKLAENGSDRPVSTWSPENI
jgi:capsule polysaccharide modification protein KpsS